MCREIGAIAIILLSAACDGNGSNLSSGPTVSDSAGITIVEHAALDAGPELLASTTPALQIGVVTGAEELQLYQVADVKRLSDGAIVVANGGTREIRIYEPDGRHRATAGGAGRGPSEFRYPSHLVILAGDTIQVDDFMDRVYFTAQGQFLKRETTDRGAFAALWSGSGGASEGGQWLSRGTLFAPVYHWSRTPPVAGPPFRPSMILVRVTADFARIDTLGTFGGIEQQYVEVGGRRGVSATVPPFATNTSWALGTTDGTIIVGDNAAPQIDVFTSDGGHMIIRWRAATEAVTGAEVEAWKDRQRNAEWTQGQLPELERAWASMEIPDVKPYYGRVFTGSDGTIWAQSAALSELHTTLHAFAADGRYLGTASMPGNFEPHDSGPGWLLGILRDENNVEFVQLYELTDR